MKQRGKKALLVTTLAAALAAGTLFYDLKPSQGSATLAVRSTQPLRSPARATTSSGSSKDPRSTAAPSTASTTGSSSATAVPVSYTAKSGVFTGPREYAYYGYVQVQAVVRNGKVKKVKVLQHPNDNGTSRYINSIAMPYLVQEAVQAQSSHISLVSGATLSSEAFVKSLSTALTQAGA